jgi:putative phosphoribosyl transferase
MKYLDRKHAGLVLSELLKNYNYNRRKDVIVLALPRGGVPVAYEIAMMLCLELDVFIVRKLGVPGHEELAMGALASGGTVVFNDELINYLQIQKSSIDSVIQPEQKELMRREHLYRGNKPFPHLTGKTIILVDDGIATGSTMKAAIMALQQKQPKEIVVAVPVAALSTCDEISGLVKTLICPLQPVDFHAVGLWYDNFSQTSDEEVIELLEQSRINLKQASD